MDRGPEPTTQAGMLLIARVAFMSLLALVMLPGVLVTGACGWGETGSRSGASVSPPGAEATVGSSTASPGLVVDPGQPSPAADGSAGPVGPFVGTSPDASPRAQAVATAAVARRFCGLVDEHRYGAALTMLASPSVWPLHELQAVRRLHFDSVQVWGEPAAREVTLLVTFTARVSWRSPLTDGVNDVFFTLTRRVTTGEWLIAAVSTSP
jgi:hypothetical protein